MVQKKQEKGITLIALVITVIVLIILAGVSISSLNPGDGIIDKASNATNEWNNAINNDEKRMDEVIEMNNKINTVP